MSLERLLEAMVHPVRLPMLAECEERPCSIGELAEALNLTEDEARQHVGVLVEAGLLIAGEDSRYAAVDFGEAFDG
jgi:DNA-binding transcriptional ArsR family regulator